MANLENVWVSYLTRSYRDIKTALLNRLKVKAPEITDYTDSNIIIIVISMMAGLMEQLHYYIDNMARESFITTARRFTSMVKLTRVIDYRVKASNGTFVDILVTLVDDNGDPINSNSIIVIPKGTYFITSDGTQFKSTYVAIIGIGNSYCYVPTKQVESKTAQVLGITNGLATQKLLLPSDYQDGSLVVTIAGNTYTLVNTFGFSYPTSRHCIVEVDENKDIWLILGDGLNGIIPPVGQNIVVDYQITKGTNGRISENSITGWGVLQKPDLSGSGGSDLTVDNPFASTGGTGIEGIEDIRKKAPLSLRTLDRAVTEQDFIDMALLINGVSKAAISYNNTSGLTLFILPIGGGIVPSSLKGEIEDYFRGRAVYPLEPTVVSAGESKLVFDMVITGKFRKFTNEIYEEVSLELLNTYGVNNVDLNQKIRISDVIANVEKLSTVDYVDINFIYLKPYPRPRGTSPDLVGEITVLPGNNTKTQWDIYYLGSDFSVYKNGVFAQSIEVDTTYNIDSQISINIPTGFYTTGNSWQFYTYPYNKNIELDDNTVPILVSSNLNLTIIETLQ